MVKCNFSLSSKGTTDGRKYVALRLCKDYKEKYWYCKFKNHKDNSSVEVIKVFPEHWDNKLQRPITSPPKKYKDLKSYRLLKDENDILKPSDVARILGVTTNTVLRYNKQGLIKSFGNGRGTKYQKDDVKRFILSKG